jgi:transmembrane sensor
MREALTLPRLRAMEPDEAAALFLAVGVDELTPPERAIFDQWLAQDEGHRHALDRARRAWAAFDDAEGDELLGALRAQALRPVPTRPAAWRGWGAVAAALAIVIAIGLTLTTMRSWWDPQPAEEGARYASGRGEVKAITLPDGSVMTLDAESAATMRYSSAERKIMLEGGRAHFVAAPDAARPFAVIARNRRVVAMGTRFEVNLAARALMVTLTEGRVRVGPAQGSGAGVMLEPGQQFVERDGVRVVRNLAEGAQAVSDWRRGLLNFEDQPLGDAVTEVNRHSPEQIVVRDPRVARLRISGQFKAGEGERFARTVAEIHPVRTVRRGGEIELVPAN